MSLFITFLNMVMGACIGMLIAEWGSRYNCSYPIRVAALTWLVIMNTLIITYLCHWIG